MSNIKDFIKFLNKSTNPYEAIRSLEEDLKEIDAIYLPENEAFKLEKGKTYYTKRNNSSLIAFKIPNNFCETNLDDLSFNISAAHTDSPTFKLKPNNKIEVLNHYIMLNTEVYGGPIYSSFFDRPLSISGRLYKKEDNKIVETLINFDKDLLVIPNECIHFNRDINSGKNYNPQIDLLPLLGTKKDLYDLINDTYKIKKEDILSFDLTLYSRFRGSIIGSDNEFILAPQIDDLECVYGTYKGFKESNPNKSISVFVAFDNEEVGSHTKQGAASNFLKNTLKRIYKSFNLNSEALNIALANSLLVSADNAHAVHPNDVGKTDSLNKVFMNEGIVIKHNANQSYTTDASSDALFSFIMDKAKVKVQHFTNRSDVRGGGTLGAISESQVSILSVDIGLPQLAMHSCVETAGVKDLDYLINGMKTFFGSHILKTCDGYNVE